MRLVQQSILRGSLVEENAHEKSLFLLCVKKKLMALKLLYKAVWIFFISDYELSGGSIAQIIIAYAVA